MTTETVQSQQRTDRHPVQGIQEKINQIVERMSDGQDIFERKYKLVEDTFTQIYDKVKEDKSYLAEMKRLR